VKTLLSIQYLRAAAALAVVLFHALQWTSGGFEVGRAGVDVFFVISGVIMWWVTADAPVGPEAFLWRRLTRVAPLYWLASLAVAGGALVSPAFLPEVLLGWRHLALSLAFIPHFDPHGRPFPLLPPGWTLTYEAAFYLVFAGALLAPKRWRAQAITAVLTAIVAAGFLLSDPAYILGANPMLLEFAAGVWLGKLYETRRLPGRAWGFALATLGVAAFTILEITGFINELWRPLLWGVPAALIVAGGLSFEDHWIGKTRSVAHETPLPRQREGGARPRSGWEGEGISRRPPTPSSSRASTGAGPSFSPWEKGFRAIAAGYVNVVGVEPRGSVIVSRALKTLGDASYAIYLVHLPATALVAHTLGYARPWLFVPAAMAASIAAGLICRALLEKPLLALLRGTRRQKRLVAGAG
jgi:exopolysaccharide production protein ExoZ